MDGVGWFARNGDRVTGMTQGPGRGDKNQMTDWGDSLMRSLSVGDVVGRFAAFCGVLRRSAVRFEQFWAVLSSSEVDSVCVSLA